MLVGCFRSHSLALITTYDRILLFPKAEEFGACASPDRIYVAIISHAHFLTKPPKQCLTKNSLFV